jgi:hypothetical protein
MGATGIIWIMIVGSGITPESPFSVLRMAPGTVLV